ncbi:uncharacterized protein DUF348 [Flavimobilis soli]|uniref:Uncharacterized protein DUF348 n=1 Tax=Flavimobilis soli TaxID=442709 RepID=A0A2A9EEY6_9MICO|nr:G5 domain-containing protein [Flavimobilis soli]PFG37488.1 uncharacterized protein DUF348 [Flavimobilis soli]
MSRSARPLVSGAIVLGVCALTVGGLKLVAPLGDVAWGDPPPVVVADGAELLGADAVERTDGAVSRGEVREGAPVPVTVSLDGDELEVTTTATTVSDLLVAQGVVLDGYATSHDLDAPVQPGMRVVVARVEWDDETLETEVPFETVEVEDPTLPEGQRVVRTAGRPGSAVTTFLVSRIDGVEVSRSEVVSLVATAPVDEVVRVGTGTSPTPTSAPTRTPSAPTAPTQAPTTEAGPAADPDPAGEPEPDPKPETAPDPKPDPKPTSPPTDAPAGTPGTTPASAKELARGMAADRGWTGKEYSCLVSLWQKESGWRYQAANPSSTARGIPQAIMSIHFGAGWRESAAAARYLSTPSVQIAWGLSYIANRYDAPCDAWAHSQAKNWY